MKNKLHCIVFLLLTAYCSLLTAAAQTPTVEKIEPPNWWANYSVNPVRVLVRGQNLGGANVIAPNNSGLKSYNFRASDNVRRESRKVCFQNRNERRKRQRAV